MARKAKESTVPTGQVVRPIEGGDKFAIIAWHSTGNVVVVTRERLKQIVEQGMEFL